MPCRTEKVESVRTTRYLIVNKTKDMAKRVKSLHTARKAKNDEFYTQLSDIERELAHYDFSGKRIYCNCDDPDRSNFYRYFRDNFDRIGLRSLVCTCYCQDGQGKYASFDGSVEERRLLFGDGDFRSPECTAFLQDCDTVVTNPPFSLFREYFSQLVEHGKQFLIVGSMNAVTYKEIFRYIQSDQAWLGYGFQNSDAYFSVTPEIALENNYAAGVYDPETGLVRFRNCVWFTNIDHEKRNTPMVLTARYSPESYPRYENYDAIEVPRLKLIPGDYEEAMGLPITFLNCYCPEQFQIIWTTDRSGDGMLEEYKLPHDRYDAPVLDGKGLYKRILVKKR